MNEKKMVMAGKRLRKTEEVHRKNESVIFVRLTPEEKEKVERAAKAEERSLSQFVRRTVLAAVGHDDE